MKLNYNQCSECATELTLVEFPPGHVGFDVYRCNQCCCSLSKHKSRLPPSNKENKPIEDWIEGCECGGQFIHNAPLRCSECRGILDLNGLKRPAEDLTKRHSEKYYIQGYKRPLAWKDVPR